MKIFFLAALLAGPARAAAPAGILLLAHGGDPSWNAQIEAVRSSANAVAPTELALGMADPVTLQSAIDRLESRGVSRIVAVPLFVNTRSEVIEQTRYVLGLSDKPSEVLRQAVERMKDMPMPAHAHPMHLFSLQRVHSRVSLLLTPALDDDAFVASVLLERARVLSRDPGLETVILVAHGPVDDAAESAWETALARHAESVRREGKFRAADFAVLRDDAAPSVRAAAVKSLRAKVAAASKSGKALVVPVLIARGGIEDKIPRDLSGLDFSWSGQALLPHPGFDEWVLRRERESLTVSRSN